MPCYLLTNLADECNVKGLWSLVCVQGAHPGGQKYTHIQFVLSVNNDQYKQIISYNDIIDNIEHKEDEYFVRKSKYFVSHQGPLIETHPNYKEYWYNIMIKWDTGRTTKYTISTIAEDYSITCVMYSDDFFSLLGT